MAANTDMQKLRIDILNYYMDKLTEEELANYSYLSDEEIIRIVNRLWKQFLSKDFVPGGSFKFLGTFVSPLELLECDDILDRDEGYVRLLSSDKLNFVLDEMDLITEIDWSKAQKVLLPIHFKDSSHYIRGGLSFRALLVANEGESVISPAVDYAEDNPLGLPFYNLDLTVYDKDRKVDYEKIVLDVICYYILQEHHKMDFALRKVLIKKYRKFIISTYSSMREYCTSDEMLNFMFKHIREKEMPIEKNPKL